MADCLHPIGAFSAITFARWSEVADRAALEPRLDAIFFEASLTRTFADDAARAAFRERWLGRFLEGDPSLAHIALGVDAGGGRAVLGYLVGALDDPALSLRFSDIGYFAALAELTARFPAHLHINLAPSARGFGIGQRLVERFAGDVRGAGLPGFHVVTGARSRNISFYRRAGLDFAHPFTWSGTDLVLLGRRL
jgi:GNAT superfamily N-acetyltransferase